MDESCLFTTFDKKCLELLGSSPKERSRHCFRSAINHLEKARLLESIDMEMALFRGITAEEEAAAGLISLLKEKHFANADKLNFRQHMQKAAVSPFLSVLAELFSGLMKNTSCSPILHIQEIDGKRRLTAGIRSSTNENSPIAYPIPPLNLSITSEEQRISYKQQIENLVTKTETKDVLSYIRDLANQRNEVLYASPEGYPTLIELKPEFLEHRKIRVMAMLRAYLMIYPYPLLSQPFVQDALDAYLAMLGLLKDHDLHAEI